MLRKLLILWRLLDKAIIKETKEGFFISLYGVEFEVREGKFIISASNFIQENSPFIFSNCTSDFIESILVEKVTLAEKATFLKEKDPINNQKIEINLEQLEELCLVQQD